MHGRFTRRAREADADGVELLVDRVRRAGGRGTGRRTRRRGTPHARDASSSAVRNVGRARRCRSAVCPCPAASPARGRCSVEVATRSASVVSRTAKRSRPSRSSANHVTPVGRPRRTSPAGRSRPRRPRRGRPSRRSPASGHVARRTAARPRAPTTVVDGHDPGARPASCSCAAAARSEHRRRRPAVRDRALGTAAELQPGRTRPRPVTGGRSLAKTRPGSASQTACTALTRRIAVTIIPETLWSPSSPWWVKSMLHHRLALDLDAVAAAALRRLRPLGHLVGVGAGDVVEDHRGTPSTLPTTWKRTRAHGALGDVDADRAQVARRTAPRSTISSSSASSSSSRPAAIWRTTGPHASGQDAGLEEHRPRRPSACRSRRSRCITTGW